MAVDYAPVIADLRAKRDAMSELIAALDNIARLTPTSSVIEVAAAVETGRAAMPTATPAPARPAVARAPVDRRAVSDRRGKWDDAVLAVLGKAKNGKTLSEIATAVGGNVGTLHGCLARLVDEKRITREGRVYRAASPAKEGL